MIKQISDWQLEIEDSLWSQIQTEYKTKEITPPQDKLFLAFELTSLEQTKVVIFGQDPYPTRGVATGLAFSANNICPHSLRNLFKELHADLGIERTNTDLSDWAKQGVLLLNTALTVQVGKAGSHSKIGWDKLIYNVIDQLNVKNEKVIFVLLGNNAKKLKKNIKDSHIVLEFTHPSPLSAYRGFWGCKMFSAINDNLTQNNQTPIQF